MSIAILTCVENTMIGFQYGLPHLGRDRDVPDKLLERRDAMSFSSSDSVSNTSPTVILAQRRGGISFDQTDKNAVYIRSGAEVKVLTKPELARDYIHHEREIRDRRRRSSLLQEADLKILEKLENPHYRTRCGLRFLSLHRVRRRSRPALKCTKENGSVLDTQYIHQAQRLLSSIGDWEFNMFTLNKLTNGRALFHTSLHLFQEHNLIDIFNLDIVKLMRFISLVEEGYHSSNPYHNAVHAADVAQAMHCYLIEPKLAKSLSPLEKLAAIVSAITHDLDHPGVNQAFLIATSNHLASLYNNTSVLENHHWRSAVGLLHESGIFDHFDNSLWKTMEWQLKSLILATDITRQQEFLSRLKNHLDQKNLNVEDIEHKNFIMQIALKCADICNPCRPWEISRRWSELVCDEFFKQGDCERQLNVPVTPLCDRYSTTVAKIQTGFMKFVVTPLFQEWCRFNPTSLSERMLANIGANHANWDRVAQEAEAQKIKEQDTLPEEEEEEDDEEEETSPSNQVPLTTVVVIEKEPVHEDPESSEVSSSLTEIQASEDPDSESQDADPGPMCLYRRHSLPPPLMACRDGLIMPSNRRDSFPRNYPSRRRYSLPVGDMPNSSSFDRLVDKLSSLVECSPTNGTHFDYDQRPRVVSISQSLDAKTLSSATLEATKQTSAHGLNPALLAHRQFSSEPQIAMLANHYRLNSRSGNLGNLTKNLTSGLFSRSINSRDLVLGTTKDKLQSSLPSFGLTKDGEMKSKNSESPQRVLLPQDRENSNPSQVSRSQGHAKSLSDSNVIKTERSVNEMDPLLSAAKDVDISHLSGVETRTTQSCQVSRSLSSNPANHNSASLIQSYDSISMAISNNLRSPAEEETPLLDDHSCIEASQDHRRLSSHSHANDSFAH